MAGGGSSRRAVERARWIDERGIFWQKGDFGCIMWPVQMPRQLQTLDNLLAQAGLREVVNNLKSAIRMPRGKRADWSRRNPGVAASRQSAANFRRGFKWRLSPEIRYAEDGLVASKRRTVT